VFVAERNIFHLRGLTLDGVVGLSVVAAARSSIGLGLAAETFGATFFLNGLNVGGFLKHPGKLDKAARQAIRESLAARHEGAANAHRWLILQDGMTAEQIGLSPEDSQFSGVAPIRRTGDLSLVPLAANETRRLQQSDIFQ
jgi:HK97 family phage portal protein